MKGVLSAFGLLILAAAAAFGTPACSTTPDSNKAVAGARGNPASSDVLARCGIGPFSNFSYGGVPTGLSEADLRFDPEPANSSDSVVPVNLDDSSSELDWTLVDDPEPMTLSLMGAGLLGIGLLGRRHLRKKLGPRSPRR